MQFLLKRTYRTNLIYNLIKTFMKNTQAEEALIRKYLTESEQGALESVFSTETNEAITNRAINK
jgi:hypothetical protein